MKNLARRSLVFLLPMMFPALLMNADRAAAGPAPPPGGHHPIFFGGDNAPGYPPFITSGVGERPDVAGRHLEVSIAPNPFRTQTTFSFVLNRGESGTLRLYTVAGRILMETPVIETTGSVSWDGRDARGRLMPSGIYYYRITTGSRQAAGTIVLTR